MMRYSYVSSEKTFEEFIAIVLEADKDRAKLLAEGAKAKANAIGFTKYCFCASDKSVVVIGNHHRLMNSPSVDLHHFFHNSKREFLKLEERRENPQTDEVTRPGAFR